MSPLFGPKYDDEQLCMRAEHALAEEPVVNAANIGISSEKGVVTLTGRVASQREKNHAVEAVRHAFEAAGLKYERIRDELIVGEATQQQGVSGSPR